MLCLKLSPSSINTWLGCQQKYFIQEVLNYRGSSGKAACLGTTLHKFMEILGKAKLFHQQTGDSKILVKDDSIGKYECNTKEWNNLYDVEFGSKKFQIFALNQVKDIFDLVYIYYSNLYSEQQWGIEEKEKLTLWTYIALNEANQYYDPRKRKVFQPEQYLSYKIDEEWGSFDYGDGVEGNVKLNGIIDIIYENDDGSYHIVDYKSGSRKDFNTGLQKDANSLRNDIQLMSYYYLMNKLYPQIDNLVLNIFYIKDGGVFTPFFEKSDLVRIENKLKEYYTDINQCQVPKLLNDRQADFKCRKFCDYSKMFIGNKCLCAEVRDRIKKDGIDKVTNELRQK